jgi:hypothetical protein
VLDAIAFLDGGLDAALDLLGLAPHHRGLVGDPDPAQVEVGVEPLGVSAPEAFQERRFIPAVADVIAKKIGLAQVEQDEVVPFAANQRPARGGLGLLMLRFAVDDGGHVARGVLPDALPNAHHVAAGRIDDLAAALADLRQGLHIGAERGDDHHVLRGEPVEIGRAGFIDEVLDAQFADLLVDLRVMDDLAQDEDPAIRKHLGGGVGEVDGPFDAVTEAELLGQFHGDLPHGDGAAIGPQVFDDFAAVMGLDLGLHQGHHLGRPQVDPLGLGSGIGWDHVGQDSRNRGGRQREVERGRC